MKLPTKSGMLELRQLVTAGACEGCGVRGGGLAELESTSGSGEQPILHVLCGSCLSAAAGIHIRRRRAR